MKLKRNHFIYEVSQEYLVEVDDYINKRDKLKIVNPNAFILFLKFVLTLRIKPHLKICLLLQLISGARISEVLGIKKGDVDWDTGAFTLNVLKKNSLGRKFKSKIWIFLWMFIPPIIQALFKTKEVRVKTRTMHIPQALLPLVWDSAEGKGDDEYLFDYRGTGVPYHRSSVYKRYMDYFGLTTHAIRHSRITYFRVTEEKSIDWIKDIFFFSDQSTVLRYINRSSSLETQAAAETLDEALKESA